ncbi:HNH endonuclease [Mycobacterium phage JuicyJay]|uniref:HNH endonuclease n=1 Tax=Mycobacterium phage Thibault TaxID=1052673 RepID=G1FGH1_9CAUD|nr:HNH endonuclease [Mycobacterium phage Thibault]QBJ00072.1 HNH endonuclease [Mycobacterium phage Phoebus]QDM57940.1 HNH endonuclease [Mycobacterium phage NihilNomen]QDP43869.1 HNH endonuclease [Mycobacterium phage Dallas]QZD97996.1 HNH endonuclease [Mycobacterium phage Beem]UEM46606.1 HNH endonuclease [Mycobacterium phage JuicyJay]
MNEKQCREIVRNRADDLCERCGSGGGLTLHHRRNRSQMPKSRHWEVANASYLCGDGTRGCHGWATVNPRAAAKEGWHVKPWEEPADIPVRYRGEWVLLREDGSIGMIDEA